MKASHTESASQARPPPAPHSKNRLMMKTLFRIATAMSRSRRSSDLR